MPHYVDAPHRTPVTVVSHPQWRTVRRNGVKIRLPERNVRVMWMEGKLHIWRDDIGKFWWVRCDICLLRNKVGSFSPAYSWKSALKSAWRHAWEEHNVRL